LWYQTEYLSNENEQVPVGIVGITEYLNNENEQVPVSVVGIN